jgi:tRNA-specific 2-thiouridylase
MSLGRAVVAMSGGVDSSVAAAMMVEKGYETIGVTLQLLPGSSTGFGCCGSPADISDAKAVASRLGISHYVITLDELFEDTVIRPFVASYLAGETPNPCVSCNRFVKFGHLLGLAEAWGATVLATGHYAQVKEGGLYRAKDELKDQTYFLYTLGPREISRLTFPIGELSKSEVRSYARKLGLETADKPESQEICFVPRRDYREFIKSRVEGRELVAALRSGPVKDASNRELGRHQGTVDYTIGQRKGLGFSSGAPRYVVRLEPETQTVIVGSNEETLATSCKVSGMIWTRGIPFKSGRANVRIRHRHAPAGAEFNLLDDGSLKVSFDAPQRAVTPGQAVVFYRDDEVLGGGTIQPERISK